MATNAGSKKDDFGERSDHPADRGSALKDSMQEPNISINNTNQNILHGSGSIFNYNPSIIYFGDAGMSRSDAIQMKISAVLKSRHIPQAVYSAQIGSGCMHGTRVQILREIEAWIKDIKGHQIFWLTGMAGTGKSAVAWTVCSHASDAEDIVLGGSFFCSRSTSLATQRDVRCVVPTLAQIFSRQSTAFAEALAAELTLDPDVLHQQVGAQIEKLLYKPLLAIKESLVPILFVIDALDECGGQLTGNEMLDNSETHRIVSDMLEALVTFSRSTKSILVKFLVTSRPETHIRDTNVSDATFSKILRLHTVDEQQVTADLTLYISNRLFKTATLRALFTEDDVTKLVRLCDGLFIVAATALEYALGAGPDVAVARFKSLLNSSRDGIITSATTPLDQMYAVILEEAARDDEVATDKLQHLLRLLAALLSTRMALSVEALADLLDQPIGQLRASMSRLHAVVHIPDEDGDAGLRPLHASFGDYLLARAPSRMRISAALGNDVLAQGCIHVMAKRLCFNISNSRSSFERNALDRPRGITHSLEYACLHWAYHFSVISEPRRPEPSASNFVNSWFLSWTHRERFESRQSELDHKINDIFRPRLLFWLEVMSVLGQVKRAAAILIFAAATVHSNELSEFLRDANSFVASSHEAIEYSATHIYISALPLADKSSLVYQDFAAHAVGLLDVSSTAVPHHAGRLVMTLTGHEGAVNSVAYSPDGLLLCSASTDETVRIWDMRTGEEIATPLRSGDGTVWSVIFAPNSKSVASGTESSQVCVWSLPDTQEAPRRLTGHSGAVSSVLFSSNGSHLTSASSDKTVRLWNVVTNQQLAVLAGHTGTVYALAFAPDSLTLASGSEDRTIQVWDVATGQPSFKSPYHYQHPIYSVGFMPDGQKIAMGCGHDIALCKPQNGLKIATVFSGSYQSLSVRPSSNGQSIVSGHGKSVCLTTLPRSTVKMSSIMLDGHTDTVRAASFSPDDLYVISGSDDRTIKMWSTSGKAVSQSAVLDEPVTRIISDSRELRGHEHAVLSVAISPDGASIVSGSADQSICVWDARSGKRKLPPLLGHMGWVFAVAISADGRLIASGSADMEIRLWDAQTGQAVSQPMQGHTAYVTSLAFASDAQWLVSGSDDQTGRIWDIAARSSSAVGPLRCGGQVHAVAFSPDGRLVATGDTSGAINLWEKATGQQARRAIQSDAPMVYSIGFSPDGTRIVSAGHPDRTGTNAVHIWNINTGERVLAFLGHTESVYSAIYSPDGYFIATGSADGIIRLWDSTTGALIAQLQGHRNSVHCVAFTPNGRSLASSSWDTSIRIWDLIEGCWSHAESDSDSIAVLNSAMLTDGWLRTPSGDLLLWVPIKYRKYLYRLRGTPRRIGISVGTSGWHRGESWTSCWRGN